MTNKRLVIVEWLDAACDSSWQTEPTQFVPAKVTTVGWLWQEDDEIVVVVATVGDDGSFNQTMAIPRGMVTSIRDAS